MLTITSCQKDDAPLETVQEGPQFQVEKLTGSQLSNNRSLNKALINAKENLGITMAQKSFYDSINGFWIDDSKVNHLTSGDYESFTYAVYKNGDSLNNKIYNLMLTKQADSSFNSTFITVFYNADVNAVANLQQDYIGVTSQSISTVFQKNGDLPFDRECDFQDPTDCNCMRNLYSIADPDIEGSILVVQYAQQCPETIDAGDTGSGGTGTGNDNSNNNQNNPDTSGDQDSSNPGGSPGDSTDGNSPPVDDPCDGMLMSDGSCGDAGALDFVLDDAPSEVSEETQEFFDSLDEDERRHINDNNQDELRTEVEHYLQEESFSDDAKGFAQKAIEADQDDENSEIDFENESIFDPSVPDCLKAIINRLKPTNGYNVDMSTLDSSLAQQLNLPNQILELFNNDKNYGLTFNVGELPLNSNNQPVNAQTSDTAIILENGSTYRHTTITINSQYVAKATDLALARTAIHELIHAYLYYSINTNPNGTIGNAILNLVDNSGVSIPSAQHKLMSSNFVDSMSKALARWDNYQYSSINYDYLAWSGDMINSDIYNELDDNFKLASDYRNKVESGIPDPNIGLAATLGDKNC